MASTIRKDTAAVHNMWSGVPIAPAGEQYVPQLNNPFTIQQQQQQQQQQYQRAEQEAPTSTEQNLGFPVRLHYMLTDINKEGSQAHIVSWQPHGRCFVVHDKKQFVEKILALWFRQSKWASFQRQLNMYGFKRISSGPDKGGYYHDMFLQTAPQMAQRIVRQKLKGTGPRRPAQPDSEPNFYSMALPIPEESYGTPVSTTTLNTTTYADDPFCGAAGRVAAQHGAGMSLATTANPAQPSFSAPLPAPPASSITLRNSIGMPLWTAATAFPVTRPAISSAEEVIKRDVLESLILSGVPGTEEEEATALEDPGLWRYLGGL